MVRRARRLTVVAALAVAGGSAALLGAPDAEAHVCAQARAHHAGSTTPVGSCHPKPCPTDHMGTGADVTHEGTGAGGTVCVGF